MMGTNKGDIFIAYLEQVLAGVKDIGPVEDAEIAGLIEMARTMIVAGHNIDNEIRENLRQQIMRYLSREGVVLQFTGKENKTSGDELDDDDLDYVAAGLAGPAGEVCPNCGRKHTTAQGRCVFCGH